MQYFKNILWIFCITFLLISICYGQHSGDLKGETWDSETKIPIKDVIVFVDSLNIAMLTDTLGKYYFKNLSPGKYKIIFRVFGYQDMVYNEIGIMDEMVTTLYAPMVPLVKEDFPADFCKKKKNK